MQVYIGEAKKVSEVALVDIKAKNNLSEIKFKKFVDEIIMSQHKTFKYILF